MGTQIQDEVVAWGKEVLEEQARERAAIDAQNVKLMKELQREEEEATRRDFEEEIHRLGLMREEGFLSSQEHARLCAVAQKDLDEKIAWGRAFGPGLVEILRR